MVLQPKMLQEISKKTGTILKEEDLIVAVENWRNTGEISKAVMAAMERLEWLAGGRYGRTIRISDKRMYQISDHFNRHGRDMGYASKKENETGTRKFFQDHMDDAEIWIGRWNNSRGMQSGLRQIIVRAEGKQLIINKKTGQLIDFYEGTSLDGFIQYVRWQQCR